MKVGLNCDRMQQRLCKSYGEALKRNEYKGYPELRQRCWVCVTQSLNENCPTSHPSGGISLAKEILFSWEQFPDKYLAVNCQILTHPSTGEICALVLKEEGTGTLHHSIHYPGEAYHSLSWLPVDILEVPCTYLDISSGSNGDLVDCVGIPAWERKRGHSYLILFLYFLVIFVSHILLAQ